MRTFGRVGREWGKGGEGGPCRAEGMFRGRMAWGASSGRRIEWEKCEHLSRLRERKKWWGRGISGRRNVRGEDGVGHIESGRTFGRLVRNKATHYPGALGVPFRLRQSQGDRKRINVLLHAVRMAPQHPVEVAAVAGRSPAGQTPPGRSWRASAPGWGRSSGCAACWSLSAPSPA